MVLYPCYFMFPLQMLLIVLRIPLTEQPSNYDQCKACVNVSTEIWNTWSNLILVCDVKVTKKTKTHVSACQTPEGLICAFVTEKMEGGGDTMCVQSKDSFSDWNRKWFLDKDFFFRIWFLQNFFGFLFRIPILTQNEIPK